MSRPPGSKNKPKEDDELHQGSLFNGIARSVVCWKHPDGHNNFRIVTLTIEDDEVVKKMLSDGYASFEAISKLDLEMNNATLALNNRYEDGKAWNS